MNVVNMGDIAAKAGVHRTTVSMALRNHPKLPKATRERIQSIAREMGYAPNPMVSALMRYRAGRRTPQAQGEIAFFTCDSTEENWRNSLAYRKVFEGARQRASEIGFRLTPFWLRQPGMTRKRLARTLHLRGIRAAMVAPVSGEERNLDWVDWSRLSAVALGYSLRVPGLHRISHDYFHGMIMAVENGRRLGYRRLGLVLNSSENERVDHLWLGGWLVMQKLYPQELLPPLLMKPLSGVVRDEVVEYVRLHKPDAICSLPSLDLEGILGSSKKEVFPARISLGCYEREGEQVGIYQNYERIGHVAVELVSRALYSSEMGVPEQGYDTLVRGIWLDDSSGRHLDEKPARDHKDFHA